MKRIIFHCCLVVLSFLGFTGSLQAVEIPLTKNSVDSGWSIVLRSDLLSGNQIAYPYVFSITAEAVIIELDKTFWGSPDEYGSLNPLTIEFYKRTSSARPNIVIHDERIINNTTAEWFDYHMFLLVDPFGPQAGFDPTKIPYGDQFEIVSYGSYLGYNNLPIELNYYDTDGKGVPNQPLGEDIFQTGVYVNGNGQQIGDPIVIVVDSTLRVGGRFGLKQVPTIPEPATIGFLVPGVFIGLYLCRRKKV